MRKAKEDIDRNDNGDRALLVDIKDLSYSEAATKVGHALHDEGILDEEIETDDWSVLSRQIKKRLLETKNEIPYLLLLLDEADRFIETSEECSYRPFEALKDIQSIGTGRFKFVIAGLHNIVRFKKDSALSRNKSLTHLDSLTVKPFKVTEARELLEIPLHYLGLQFPKEEEYLITLILASTNYFPGLIQLYCAKLLEAMRAKDYAGYDEGNTPVYEISEEHIKHVLSDPEFREQIREKYYITLKLDEDDYYYIIALIVAYLCHDRGYGNGYTVDDILDISQSLGITKISSLGKTKLGALMEEMKELNVLKNIDSDSYLFTRTTFFQMMGTKNDVEDNLTEYIGE